MSSMAARFMEASSRIACVRTASRLDAHDAFRRQRLRAGENELVFLCINVVSNDVDVVVVPSRLHSASTSAVLPEPTGPPIPTRKGP
jgi:hypothetical protein